jgi:hypothetical protein
MNSLGIVFLVIAIIVVVIIVILLVVSGLRNESTPPPPPPPPPEEAVAEPLPVEPVFESLPMPPSPPRPAPAPILSPRLTPRPTRYTIQLSPDSSEVEEEQICLSDVEYKPPSHQSPLPEIGLDGYSIIDACQFIGQFYFLDINRVRIINVTDSSIREIVSSRPIHMLIANQWGIFGLSRGTVVMLDSDTLTEAIWKWIPLTDSDLTINWFQIFRDRSMWVQTQETGIMYVDFEEWATSKTKSPKHTYEFTTLITQRRIYDDYGRRYVELEHNTLDLNGNKYHQVCDFAWNGTQPVMLQNYQLTVYRKLVHTEHGIARLLNTSHSSLRA